jgi:ubiquinone/menaquinone biosynthesis C-methylase UbiE
VDDRASDPHEWLERRLRALTSGTVLDAGCGEGRFLPADGVGLDIDEAPLLIARTRSHRIVRADARALPFTAETFDTAYAIRMLNDTGDVDGVLGEIARVLRRGGRLIVFTRARPGHGDRLDRSNGEDRLRRHFRQVAAELDPVDGKAALFVAEGPREGRSS